MSGLFSSVMGQRFIRAKTLQPRYSRRYLAYRAGEVASSARIWPANSSSGLASSQRRIFSHGAAAYRSITADGVAALGGGLVGVLRGTPEPGLMP
jgi:hypothetical protein